MINYKAIYYLEKIFAGCDRIYFNTNEYIKKDYRKNITESNEEYFLDFIEFYQDEKALLKVLEEMIKNDFDKKETLIYAKNIRKDIKRYYDKCNDKTVLCVYNFIDEQLCELIKII